MNFVKGLVVALALALAFLAVGAAFWFGWQISPGWSVPIVWVLFILVVVVILFFLERANNTRLTPNQRLWALLGPLLFLVEVLSISQKRLFPQSFKN